MNRTLLLATLILMLSVSDPARSMQVIFNDGENHLIDYQVYHPYLPSEHIYLGIQNEGVPISDGWALGNPDAPTYVEIASGALIGGGATAYAASVSVYGASMLDITGGTVGGTVSYRYHSSGAITDGSILNSLKLYDYAEVLFGGGSIAGSLEVFWGSELQMTGGSVAGQLGVLEAGAAVVSGGDIASDLQVIESGKAVWSGGTVGGRLFAHHRGTIEILGTDFVVNGQSVGYGELFFMPENLSGTISGTLASGEVFTNDYVLGAWYDQGTLILTDPASVPLPGTAFLLGAALLSLIGSIGITGKTTSTIRGRR